MADAIEELRELAANAAPAPEAMRAYLTKVHEGAYTVTDGDVAELKAAGFSEDEIFEQTLAVALAEGLRRFDRAMRGPSDWSAGERELFAAFTSLLNQCPF